MHLEYPYSVHHSIIPDNLCDEIIEQGEKLIKWEGLERRSGITHGFLMKAISSIVNTANEDNGWNYVTENHDRMYYQKIGWHQYHKWRMNNQSKPTINPEKMNKISFMLSLNQVDIDYHGCYFELAYGAPWTQNYLNRFDELKKGTLIVFPSFLYYRFSPVMGGDRKTISGNLIGPAFA